MYLISLLVIHLPNVLNGTFEKCLDLRLHFVLRLKREHITTPTFFVALRVHRVTHPWLRTSDALFLFEGRAMFCINSGRQQGGKVT